MFSLRIASTRKRLELLARSAREGGAALSETPTAGQPRMPPDGLADSAENGLLSNEDDEIYNGSMESAVLIDEDNVSPRGRRSSLLGATANYAVQVLGLPILVVPYSLAVSGWAIGLTTWAVIGLLMAWTALLTCRCLEHGKADYPLMTMLDMVSAAFKSPTLSAFVWFCFVAELFGSNISCYIVISDNLTTLRPELSPIFVKAVVSLVAFVMSQCLSYRLLSFTSIFGIFACLLAVLVVPFNGFTVPAGSPGSILTPAPTSMWPPHGLAKATLLFGIATGSLAAHGSLPSVYLSLKDREKAGRDVALVGTSFTLASSFYLLIGISGYLMFGDHVSEQITLDLAKLPANHVLNKTITALVLTIPLSQYPLFLEPVRLALDIAMSRYFDGGLVGAVGPINIDPPDRFSGISEGSTMRESVEEELIADPLPDNVPVKEQQSLLPAPNQQSLGSFLYTIRTPLLRLLLICLATAISIVIPSFANLLSLLGSVCSSTTALLVPLGCYLKLFWIDDPPLTEPGDPPPYRASRAEVVLAWVSIVAGIILGTVGTIGTIANMGRS